VLHRGAEATLPAVPEWSAEVVVDAALARRLIGGQFPDFAGAPLALLSEGWDNTVWRSGDWVFRFPRREIVVPGLQRELAVLPGLRLPLPVPRPELIGEPARAFPFPWFGARFLPGREPLGLTDAERDGLGRPFAEFLRALHAQPADGLPVDPIGRGEMAKRVPLTRERLHDLGLPVPEDVLAAALELPPAAPAGLTHGDLHLRHLLVDEGGRPSGVIDWIDVACGDVGIDLPLYWCLLTPAAREDFRAAYPVTDEQLLRGRVLALFLCAILALYARAEGFPALEAEALAGIRRSS
jgi:aminoglycoside phosphotransferase (APT) family kinase protein